VHSYAALMQSFSTDLGPQTKRRKLDPAPEPKSAEIKQEVNLEEAGEDTNEVEEPEDGPETATDCLLDDGDDLEDASDPFEAHFADPDDNILSRRLESLERNQWATQKSVIPEFGKVVISLPEMDDKKDRIGLTPMSGPAELKLKQKLSGVMSKQRHEFDDLEKYIAPSIFGYQDILYCERRPTDSETLRRLACLHAINHVFK
jgi:U3 small nucleolar RNA-associated protein 25